MLFYDNDRFSLGSVSFKLPNGVLLDLKDDEVLGEGFCLYAPDESFNVRIRFCNTEIKSYDGIADLLFSNETGYRIIGDIELINCNGLNGYRVKYEDKATLNEEYAFDLADCGEYTLFDIYVTISKKSSTYDEACKSRILSELFDSIEKTKIEA